MSSEQVKRTCEQMKEKVKCASLKRKRRRHARTEGIVVLLRNHLFSTFEDLVLRVNLTENYLTKRI